MAEGLNVSVPEKLRKFIEKQTGPDGLYDTAEEYIRNLVRKDYERQEVKKWHWLHEQIGPGMNADESEFIPFDPDEIIKTAKEEKAHNAP